MTAKCCVIVAKTPDEASASAADAIRRGAEVLEFRLDSLTRIPDDLSFLKTAVPAIATLRCETGEAGREPVFTRALAAGAAWIDIESDSVLRNRFPKESVICSYHDFAGTPATEEILAIFADLRSSGLPKAAFMVRGPADLISLRHASDVLKQNGTPFILIGMGPCGEITRIRAADLGSSLTYCALTPEHASAPGQITLDEAVRLGDNPVVTAITGWPLTHTFSPGIHNAAFRAAGISGRYVKVPSSPEELSCIPEILELYRISGMNVTIPHKETIIPLLNAIDPAAAAAGAVNTIHTFGGLTGYNTDILGIAASLKGAGAEPAGARTLVIGAGGAARAAVAWLTSVGADVFITNRTFARAETLAREFGAHAVPREELRPGWDIILNATPAGMNGFESHSPVPEKIFSPGTIVMDMIYDPETTPLLRAARIAGVKTLISGKTMLIEQAAASFALWTGTGPDRAVMTQAFEERTT